MDEDNKANRLDHVTRILLELVSFLRPLLDLANAHMVDYFVEDHWNRLLPLELRQALDSLLHERESPSEKVREKREVEGSEGSAIEGGTVGEDIKVPSGSRLSLNTMLREMEMIEESGASVGTFGSSSSVSSHDDVVRQFVREVHCHTLPGLLYHHRQLLTGAIGQSGRNDLFSKFADEEKFEKGDNGSREDDGEKVKNDNRFKNNTFMSTKKEHEVERMASYVSKLADDRGVEIIVDVGSGKGYLGQELASMKRNQESEEEVLVSRKIEKDSVKAGNSERIEGIEEVTDLNENLSTELENNFSVTSACRNDSLSSKRPRLLTEPLSSQRSSNYHVIGIEGNSETSHGASHRREKMAKKKGRSLLSGENKDMGPREEGLKTVEVRKKGQSLAGYKAEISDCENKAEKKQSGSFTSVAEIIKDAAHLRHVVRTTLSKQTSVIQSSTDSSSSSHSPFILCGLHACGGLTSFILQCFVDLPSTEVAAVCVVGCCYNHLNEDGAMGSEIKTGEGKSLNQNDSSIDAIVDFPLSKCLLSPASESFSPSSTADRNPELLNNNFSSIIPPSSESSDLPTSISPFLSTTISNHPTSSDLSHASPSPDRPSSSVPSHSFRLGRNARMLGNQPPARSAAFHRQPEDSLFLRAVLEVVLLRHFRVGKDFDARVGKIKNSSGDDIGYLTKALRKLGFRVVEEDDDDDKGIKKGEQALKNDNKNFILGSNDDRSIKRPELRRYLREFANDKQRLFAFFQLRTLLAPVVEAIVVIDRLTFLLEQPDVVDAGVVDIFDPVQSPRCYAVVAAKR